MHAQFRQWISSGYSLSNINTTFSNIQFRVILALKVDHLTYFPVLCLHGNYSPFNDFTHTHKETRMLWYLECLAGSTGGDLGSIVGEAGRVDGALVGVDHKTRQALYTALIPGQKNETQKSVHTEICNLESSFHSINTVRVSQKDKMLMLI